MKFWGGEKYKMLVKSQVELIERVLDVILIDSDGDQYIFESKYDDMYISFDTALQQFAVFKYCDAEAPFPIDMILFDQLNDCLKQLKWRS